MNLTIQQPGRILKNVRPLSALGANVLSRRQLRRSMIQANLKRTHHGWLKVANRLLGTGHVTVQLQSGETAVPFSYRPGSTDLLALEQVFLDGQYDFNLIAPESIRYIVDLGGNIGVTALLWARRFPAARMVLVEPNPGNFELLERNTAAFRNRCLLLNAAVSDRCGQTSFFCSEREYGHSLLKSDDCVSEIRVETLTLAAILRMAGFPRVDLLKMDIEGAEKIVMPAIDSCGAAIRHLIAELHPPYDLDNFADDCRKINLEVENFNGDMAFAACANNAGSNVKLAGGKNDPLVSIIMRSFNEARALRETLPTLAAQEYKNWELIVIDSGSTDGSVELIRSAQPRHFIQISPHEYNPARVMNHGMQLARSDFGIFLNADATPQNNNWLRPLVEALIDPQAAAVFGKQIPRPDCHAVFAHDYERCFGANRKSAGWEHFFSMASSGIRKDIWSKRGFNERLQYSEDDEWTRWCRAQNYKIIYAPESVAMHSHNYTPEQACKRSFGEARALAAVWPGARTDFNFARTVLLGWLNDARRDFFFCARKNRLGEWPHALRIRWRQRRARLAGFADGWKNYRENGTVKHVNPPLCAGQNPAV